MVKGRPLAGLVPEVGRPVVGETAELPFVETAEGVFVLAVARDERAELGRVRVDDLRKVELHGVIAGEVVVRAETSDAGKADAAQRGHATARVGERQWNLN